MRNWTRDRPIKTHKEWVSGNQDDVSSATWKNMQRLRLHLEFIRCFRRPFLIGFLSTLPMKIRRCGWVHSHGLVQFLKENVLITAIVQSRALSGEVGVGVFQSRRKRREESSRQLGFLNSQVMQRMPWFMKCMALSYSKTVWYNLGCTVFLQTQWFHFDLNGYSAVYKIFTLPF